MAEIVGDVAVRVGADTSGLTRGMADADKSMKQMSLSAHAAGTAIGMLAAEVIKAGAQLAFSLTTKGFEAVDALDKMAAKSSASVKSMQSLTFALGEAGISTEQTQMAVKKLNVAIGDAQGGNKTAQATFEKLGLSVSELSAMDADQRMAAIADAMAGYGNAADKASIASDIFGAKIGPDLAASLGLGGDAIRQASADLDAMGLSMSDIDAAKVAAANDAFSRAGMVVDGISNKLAVEFAPLLEAISKSFVEAGKEGGGFGNMVQSAVQATIKVVAFLANAIDGIKRIGVAVSDSLIYGFAMIEETFNKVALGIVSAMDIIPGVDLTSNVVALEAKVKQSQSVMAQAAANMRAQFEKPLAGDVFLKYAEDAKKASAEGAAMAAAARSASQGGDAVAGAVDPAIAANAKKLADKQAALANEIEAELWAEGEKQAQKDQMLREGAAKELARLDQQYMTEQERLAQKFEEENAIIAAAREAGISTKDELDARELQAMMAHESAKSEIEKREADKRTKRAEMEAANKKAILGDAMNALTSLMNSGSRKMFEVGKIASISQAIVSTITGATKALELGWPLGPMAAAAITAGGMSNVANIRRQTFGGGGSVGATSMPTANINAAATGTGGGSAASGPSQRSNVTLVGDYFGREAVIGLLHEAFKDGFTLSGA